MEYFSLCRLDYHMFYACPHFLSVSERKSRISSFPISNRFIYLSLIASSYCSWVSLLNCCTDGGNLAPSFRGLPFGFIAIPAASLRWFLLYLVLKSHISLYVKPNLSPVSRRVCPCSKYSINSFSKPLMCLYFCGITKPPMVVVLILPQEAVFYYCPFLLDLFRINVS